MHLKYLTTKLQKIQKRAQSKSKTNVTQNKNINNKNIYNNKKKSNTYCLLVVIIIINNNNNNINRNDEATSSINCAFKCIYL